VHFEPGLRDQIVSRVDHLNLPSYTGFVMPRLDAVKGANGEITGRDDLVSPGPDQADARILGRDGALRRVTHMPTNRMTDSPADGARA
jgi:hypothetical protein